MSAPYLGDYAEDFAKLNFKWSTENALAASVTRATDGSIFVYKDNETGTEVQTGVTDTEDFDGLTGIHNCLIDLSSAAFYATGADYSVILKAATIDGQIINAVLAHFSIENRFTNVTNWAGNDVTFGTGGPDVNVNAISDVAAAATQLEQNLVNCFTGTASGTPTATTMVSDISIAVDNQFNGRIITFDDDTTTTNLQGQSTDITACTASSNTLTFTATTTAPVSGDSFVIT